MQLDGTLDQFPLRELIEMIVYSSVTGVLEVRAADDIAQLFFRDGRPYHAAIGECTGLDAIVVMFGDRKAPFRFVADTESVEETIWHDPWELIEQGAEQARLWGIVRPRIPNMNVVPALRSTPDTEQIHISESAWPVLSAVDGQRSIAAICEALNLMPLDTCVALVSLMDQGLVILRQPRPSFLDPRTMAAQPEPAEQSSTGSDFFERLMANLPASDDSGVPDEATQIKTRSERYVADR